MIVYKRAERAIKHQVDMLEPELREEAKKLRELDAITENSENTSDSSRSKKKGKGSKKK